MAKRKPSPALKAFGVEVRRLREDASITRTELAKRVAVTPSYISQVESGNTRCRKEFAQRMDQALDTGEQLTAAWTKHLRSATYPKFFADYSEAEASAELLRAYEATFVYGLFQLESYARALLLTDASVAARMRRQEAVFQVRTPPTIGVVLSESVLRRRVGDSTVMRQQLEYLLEVSHRENISLQVAPTAYYRGVSGSFNIATQATGEELLYMETATGGVTSVEPKEILFVVGSFTMLQAKALCVDDSRTYIKKVMDEWTRA
ncbi:helix-turn-helix transcriptional regulator [Actinomadura sp. NPDC049382]|uniref:helix-turn-helix domain-containing protein n=1 Tax=Actinomadura sp. NPDC049382 TaxID=3158220 RepID=UPI003445AD9A